ncbi:MAG: L-histidine N(alpha)-methyltransferase [Betaproteobacteria bacterium]|nr:L-histidine N(alpha)-methyltransferase [Betaproteobacteria bacterium]
MARKQRLRAAPRLTPRATRRAPRHGSIRFFGAAVPADSLREEVIEGLSRFPKTLPPKYFYDGEGSRLFETICRLPEYYLTRAELALTRRHLEEIARFAGRGCELIEYGSGASLKTRALIRRLRPARYVAVDISESALRDAVRRLGREFPWLEILAVLGDFTEPLRLARFRRRNARPVVYFPGSTIGNFTPRDARAFLSMTRAQVGGHGAMLVGIDLKKDPNLLHAAYNDSRGITARFNLNILRRINRELGADFDAQRFSHYAFYNVGLGRVEMHLVCLAPHSVRVGEYRFRFERGESIHTENSCKYSLEEFQELAAEAGFRGVRSWLDRRGLFALHGLVAA